MGKWGEIVPEGVCRTLPANAQVRWDIHMFPGGLGAMAPTRKNDLAQIVMRAFVAGCVTSFLNAAVAGSLISTL